MDGKAAAGGRREGKYIMRIMRAMADTEEGHTQSDLRLIMAEPRSPGGKPVKVNRAGVHDAVTLLKRVGMVQSLARSRIALVDQYVPGRED